MFFITPLNRLVSIPSGIIVIFPLLIRVVCSSRRYVEHSLSLVRMYSRGRVAHVGLVNILICILRQMLYLFRPVVVCSGNNDDFIALLF